MGARYKKYPEYQDSLIEWLGEVPSTWEIKPCRAIVRHLVEKNEGARDQNYLSLMANIGVIKYEDKGDVGNKKPDDLAKCKIVKKGNLVINSMNYSIGSYGMSGYDGVCSPVYIILEPEESVVHRRFALRIFENGPFQKHLATFGDGILAHRAAIGWDDIKGAYIPVPSKEEQLSILNFLDHETAKIDTLIDKQQQLIKLLKEKRQTVISHAVTKGLNPDAPKKDSGVVWLGEVPAHWEVTRLKYHIALFEQGWSPLCDSRMAEDEEFGVLKVGCVNGGKFKYEEHKALPVQLAPQTQYVLKKNDLLVSRANTKELVGSAAVVDQDYDRLLLCDKLYRLRFDKQLIAQFVAFYLSTGVVRQQIELGASGASYSMQNIGQSTIKELYIAVPPINEAADLLNSINNSIAVYDASLNKAGQQVQLLQERRTALISAAVTGKIDVRNWQPPKSGIPQETAA